DIMLNRSIKDALVAEEKFFRSRPVYNDLVDRCGVPQLVKKLNQPITSIESYTIEIQMGRNMNVNQYDQMDTVVCSGQSTLDTRSQQHPRIKEI
ncbi:hypothetical protein M8C21_031325, partial [Ambrosia artemisiifolia]